ncbi:laccase-15-like [Andrographis paniculata]|uniref:laccase-15-like n=1 Tax=Andrographis paniculata TaxID=175694 RepID=UPI0021E81D0D|nr:laccase-15-like [Andrographis paniculata]
MGFNHNQILLAAVIILVNSFCFQALEIRRYRFVVKEASFKRLCEKKKILTVNGKFPGPTIKAHKGDTIVVDVINQGQYNITIHWHGVKQPRNPWSDGPEYITQCPIQPGGRFSQKVIFSKEEGTLWWHAHSDWSRATVHGAIIVYPRLGASYPFPKPKAEIPIILGEWWKEDVMQVMEEFVGSGGQPRDSDAYTINGQPGDLYPCSRAHTFKVKVKRGNTYLLRVVNAALNEILFFGVANHNLTVVNTDAAYTKRLTAPYIVITPGQTMDCLLQADQQPGGRYYIAARPYVSDSGVSFDNTTVTAVLQYSGGGGGSGASPELPSLPPINDTSAAVNFSFSLRSLNSKLHPAAVPEKITKRIVTTVSINALPCAAAEGCRGPNGTRLAASVSNISFVNPTIDILEAYVYNVPGVFGKGFPDAPPLVFNYTAEFLPVELQIPARATEVKLVKYNSVLEIVFQGTNLVAGLDHPMHLHGFSFYVVGWGLGNFNAVKDPLNYNLVDPQMRTTVMVPINGWTAVRFKADNPGVWFMHCHVERHMTWGMETVFIVRSGRGPEQRVLPPPPDMPPC